MGLLASKENARLAEISVLKEEAWQQYRSLSPGVATETAAGAPNVPGSHEAQRSAVFEHIVQLTCEMNAINWRKGAYLPAWLTPATWPQL